MNTFSRSPIKFFSKTQQFCHCIPAVMYRKNCIQVYAPISLLTFSFPYRNSHTLFFSRLLNYFRSYSRSRFFFVPVVQLCGSSLAETGPLTNGKLNMKRGSVDQRTERVVDLQTFVLCTLYISSSSSFLAHFSSFFGRSINKKKLENQSSLSIRWKGKIIKNFTCWLVKKKITFFLGTLVLIIEMFPLRLISYEKIIKNWLYGLRSDRRVLFSWPRR